MNLFYDIHNEHQHLSGTITDILNDPAKLNTVAKTSYHHALGFEKMVLKENIETGDKLCLHFWWPNAPEGDDNIHPHRWDFNSLVLIGEIKVEKYELHPEGKLFHQYIYCSPLKEEYYKLTPCGKNKVILTEEFSLKAGESYSQKYSELHRVTRKNPFVVTLFTQSPTVASFTKILSKYPIEETLQQISAIRMKEEDVKKRLSFLHKEYFVRHKGIMEENLV